MGAPAFPGRPGWPLIGNLPDVVRRGLLDASGDAWRELGDVFRIRISGGLWLHFVAHPDGAEHVLKTMRRNYVKGAAYDSFRRITGNGLLTAEGDDWRRKRRRIQPAFAGRRIAELADVMARVTGATLDEWEQRLPDGTTFDLGEEMTRITLRIVGQTLFGIDITGVENRSTRAFAEAIHHASLAGNSMRLPLWVPTPGNLRMKKNLATLDETVFEIIARGRARDSSDDAEPTLLQMLIDARDDETGEQFGDKELRDEVITMFLAGHETTALTLTWCLNFLSRHPEVLERLVEEIDREIGDTVPTMADCERLPFTRAVIEETLRMRPPAWAVARNALEDDVVMDHEIPGGALVVTAIYFIHHHPDFWDAPMKFDPDRFVGRKPRHEFDNLPFSRGPRKCVGAGFAMVESQIVLAMLLRRALPEAVESEDVPPRVRVTLHPARPIPLRLRWRKHPS
jgi:cytochrome P450